MILSTGTRRRLGTAAAAMLLAAVLAGCVSSPRFTTRTAPPQSASTPPAPSSGADTARPEAETAPADPAHFLLTTQGIASYYADEFNGRKTANGEIFDMFQMTAAHRSLPFGTTLRVTNLDNKKSVVVRINDRGPFKMERIIDLSLGAATQLEMMGVGTVQVQLDVIEWGDNVYKK